MMTNWVAVNTNEWVNVYEALGIPVGEPLMLQNIGLASLAFSESASAPVNQIDYIAKVDDVVKVAPGIVGLWAKQYRGNSGDGLFVGRTKADFEKIQTYSAINQIADTGGENNLDGVSIPSIKSLPATEFAQTDITYNVIGFYAGSTDGGGQFVWVPSLSKSNQNGGTIIAPEAIAAWNGTKADLATLLNWTGPGNGCWVRLRSSSGVLDLFWFGCDADNLLSASFAKAVSAAQPGDRIYGAFDNATLDASMVVTTAFLGHEIHLDGKINFNGFSLTLTVRSKTVKLGVITSTPEATNCVIVKDCQSSNVDIMSIDGAKYPLKMYSNIGSGCFNNTVNVYKSKCYGDNEAACCLMTVDAGGFCNENHIHMGFMAGPRGIYMLKGATQSARFDGNKFISPMFELITYRGFELQHANFNHMYDARFEGSFVPSDCWIYERADCYHNRYSNAQPIVANKLILLGEKSQYNSPIFAATGDTSIGARYASIMHFRGIGEDEGFGFAQIMSASSPNGTIALRKNLSTPALSQFAFWIKDYSGNVVGCGELDPYGYQEIQETETGDVQIISNASWIQCRPSTTLPDTTNLVMPASRQSEGRELTLYIPNTQFAKLQIKNASGDVHLPENTFNAEGIWKLFYRYSRWRAYFVGNNVKM